MRTLHTLVFASLALAACNTQPDGKDDDDVNDPSQPGPGGAFFLPTGEPDNTSAPSIEVDAQGGVHAVYPAYAGGGAYYAYCAPGCAGSDDVRVVRFETEGSVANAMIALDRDGRPQLLLAAAQHVYYAASAGDPTDPAAWTTSLILSHEGNKEVTGEAFALDGEGRPRFLMHTTVAYLGVGQKAPETHYVGCDADCLDPASWTATKLGDQIWKFSQLRFDAAGRVRLATVATVEGGENGAMYRDVGAYVECDAACDDPASWIGQPLADAFSNDLDAVAVKPTIALALTSAGAPRIALLSKDDVSNRQVVYFACDSACATTAFSGTVLGQSRDIGPGLDLALDAQDHPRLVYTRDYSIGLAQCDDARCETPDAAWNLSHVEVASEMSPDEIFLYANCHVAAWFLHSPSIALGPDGAVRVGYQARDISGGNQNPDPNDEIPDCTAGTDMTWSRLALL